MEAFDVDFENGETVIVQGVLSNSIDYAIVLQDISLKYPECKEEMSKFIGTWKHESGSSPWFDPENYELYEILFTENASWHFYENKTFVVNIYFGDYPPVSQMRWTIIDCYLVLSSINYYYEFSDEGNNLTLYDYDDNNRTLGVLNKVEEEI